MKKVAIDGTNENGKVWGSCDGLDFVATVSASDCIELFITNKGRAAYAMVNGRELYGETTWVADVAAAIVSSIAA